MATESKPLNEFCCHHVISTKTVQNTN